jgi:hypothetical protein
LKKSGTYYLEVTNENGCSAMSDGVSLILTGIEELTKSQFYLVVIPNPNNGRFKLRLENGDLGKNQVLITNENGQILMNKEIYIIQDIHEEEFSLSNHTKGIYFIKVFNGDKSNTKKVIIN